MNNFDEIFEKYQYAEKAERSIKEYNNWILGVSIGICAILLFKVYEFNITRIIYGKYFYILIVLLSLINTLISGFCKYKFYLRDIGMNIHYGELKKLLIFSEINGKKKEETQEEWNTIFSKWINEFNKIRYISRLINISSALAFISIITTGIYIVLLIIV